MTLKYVLHSNHYLGFEPITYVLAQLHLISPNLPKILIVRIHAYHTTIHSEGSFKSFRPYANLSRSLKSSKITSSNRLQEKAVYEETNITNSDSHSFLWWRYIFIVFFFWHNKIWLQTKQNKNQKEHVWKHRPRWHGIKNFKRYFKCAMISTTDSLFHPSILIVLGRLTCRTKPRRLLAIRFTSSPETVSRICQLSSWNRLFFLSILSVTRQLLGTNT